MMAGCKTRDEKKKSEPEPEGITANNCWYYAQCYLVMYQNILTNLS